MNSNPLRRLQAPIEALDKEQPGTARHRFHASGTLTERYRVIAADVVRAATVARDASARPAPT
jgi:hypothetical protein